MKQRKRKSGSALIFVLVFMVLGVTMGTALIFLTQSDMKAAVVNMQYEQTYYDAESASQMATQLAIQKINTNTSLNADSIAIFDSPLTYTRSERIDVPFADFPNDPDHPIPKTDTTTLLIEDRHLMMYEYAWKKQGGTISHPDSGFDYPIPAADASQIDKDNAEALRSSLQEKASEAINAQLLTLATEIGTALSTPPDSIVSVSITVNQADLERKYYCANARETASGVQYDYIVRWAPVDDALIFIDTTVNSRTIRASLTFRGQEVYYDGSTFEPDWSSDGRIRISAPKRPGEGVGALNEIPKVLVPVDEVYSSFVTNYDSSTTAGAYEDLYKSIEPIYKDVMETKGPCSYTPGGVEITSDAPYDSPYIGSTEITVKPNGGTITINGVWPGLKAIYVEGSGTVQFGFGAENGSDAFLADDLVTIHAPDANVIFGDCALISMEHCCMETVTFGGGGYGTYIYHAERSSFVKPYCDMVVGGKNAVPSNPDAASTLVSFNGNVVRLNDTIIFSAGKISSSITTTPVESNAIFFTAGETRVPFQTWSMYESPQFYTWGNLTVSDTGGLRGVYACSGDLKVESWGGYISGMLIGSNPGSVFTSVPNTSNCTLTPISNAIAPVPDLIAEKLKAYLMKIGASYGNPPVFDNPRMSPFNMVAVLTEPMNQGLVAVVSEGRVNDIGIHREQIFFDGVREYFGPPDLS